MGLPLELLKIIFTKHLQNDTSLLSSTACEKRESITMLGKKEKKKKKKEERKKEKSAILFR